MLFVKLTEKQNTTSNIYILSMNRLVYLLLIGLLAVGCKTTKRVATPRSFDNVTSEAYYSPQPEMTIARKRLLPDPINGLGQTNDPNLRITDVHVTSQFTIVYMTFEDKNVRGDVSRISFNAEKAHLITPDGKRRFNFIRAEGISLTPSFQDVKFGDRVDFKLYFKRLDADINEFGLYECDSDNTNTCWNVRNIILPAATPSAK